MSKLAMSPVPEARINKNLTLAVLVFFFALADRALGVVGHCNSCPVEEFSMPAILQKTGEALNARTSTKQKSVRGSPCMAFGSSNDSY